LIGSRGPQGGVEGQVIDFALGGTGLDVPAALALGVCVRSSPAFLAADLVERIFEFAWGESLPDLGLFPAIPPVSLARVEDALRGWLRGQLFSVLAKNLLAYPFFFSLVASSLVAGSGSPVVEAAPCNCSMRSCRSSIDISACWKGPRLMR
jgi:hypothetical protein